MAYILTRKQFEDLKTCPGFEGITEDDLMPLYCVVNGMNNVNYRKGGKTGMREAATSCSWGCPPIYKSQ